MSVIIDGTNGVTTPGVTNTGTDEAAVQTYNGVAMPRMVLSTAQNTTSGTSIDFTSIPSWVKRITVMFNGVSTGGTGSLLVQTGAGSVVTTGYSGCGNAFNQSNITIGTTSTAGFPWFNNSAANTNTGTVLIANISGNTWVASHSGFTNTGTSVGGGGSVTLSGTLDRLRLTTVNGTDTFDAGSVNILLEG